ncbi:MAG: MFS transporter [Desulfobacterales bacterium]|nr:MFS transporter [Desulfobacterales bacterium]
MLKKIIVTSTISRIILNTSRRFVYPFAPVISRGLGVPITLVTASIAVNQATSCLSIFTSYIADKTGYRVMMLSGLGVLVAGMLIAGAFPVYYSLLIGMFLCGLGKNLFDPAIQAYVSERVPYNKRGFVMGIMETSWAGSTLIGVPAIGFLIDRAGWRSPFFLLAGLGLLSIVLVLLTIEDDSKVNNKKMDQKGFIKEIKKLVTSPVPLSVMGFAFFVSLANDNLFVVYGVWLEKSFGLSVIALGLGTSFIGAAELLGEMSTATLADKIGLKKSVVIGVILSTLAYVAVGFVGSTLFFALSSLFFVFLFFEFFFVSFLSVCTELLPQSRATMMSLVFLCAGLGRMTGAFSGGFIFNSMGINCVGIFSAIVNCLALLVLISGIKKRF